MENSGNQQDNQEGKHAQIRIGNSFRQGWSFITMLLIAFMTLAPVLQSCDDDDVVDPLQSEKYIELNQAMRKLWSDHMFWTLATVEAFFHNDGALNDDLARLLDNQQDIGTAIVPYYGQEAGDQLTALLTTHINQAVPVLTAARDNNQAALDVAVANWNQNARDIADFLTAANPDNWPQSTTEPALLHHIEQTIDYSVKVLQNDHAGAVDSFEEALHHMLDLADTLSEGVAKQFPEKF